MTIDPLPATAGVESSHPLPIMKRLGLGLAALGRPGYINLGHGADLPHAYALEAMQRHSATVLDAAWQAGVRYFDAARSYGRAEEFLGHWLHSRNVQPNAVYIASKWGYTYTADWQVVAAQHEVKEHSLAVLQRQWQETQRSLQGYLCLYQIHSATLESGVLTNHAVLNALAALKAQGVAIGLSLSGANQAAVLEQALQVQVDGAPLFAAVQATWNLLEPSAGLQLQIAYEQGLRIIVKEALANGRLTARNQAASFAASRQLLESQAARLATTLDALALAAVLAQPWADIVLSGAATVAQLQSNLRAPDIAWDAEAEAVLASIREPASQYWKTRSALAWN
ncbi:MAG: aldo/keto reductase [Caldilineaceae bacterium]